MANQFHQQTDPQLQQSASLIERSGRSLLRLVNQILNLTKLEAGAMSLQPIRADLVGFTQYLVESFQIMAATKGIHLQFQADQPVIATDFDKDRLGDVLSNLLTNALKFTSAGGHVSCQLSTHPACPALPTDYYEAVVPAQPGEGPWIAVHIRNTGPGISAHDLPHIFDRFYQRSTPANSRQLAAETGGMGIGLSLVRELLLLMHGRLTVRSQPGAGGAMPTWSNRSSGKNCSWCCTICYRPNGGYSATSASKRWALDSPIRLSLWKLTRRKTSSSTSYAACSNSIWTM